MSVYWRVQGDSIENSAFSYNNLYATRAPLPVNKTFVFQSGVEQWIAEQSSIIAAKQEGHTNVVTIRPWAYSFSEYASLFGNNPNNWADHITPFLDNYLAAGFKVVCITSYASSPQTNINRAGMDPIIRTWPGVHCTDVVDVASDPILGADATINDTTYFDGTGHLTAVGHEILYSYFAPVMNRAVGVKYVAPLWLPVRV